MTMVIFDVSIVTWTAVALGGVMAGALARRCARRCFGISVNAVTAMAWCVVVALALTMRAHASVYLAPLLAFGWVGVLVSVIDLRTHMIPTPLLRASTVMALPLLGAGALLEGGLAGLARASVSAAFGAALGWGAMHVVWRAARGGLGYGDVRLSGYAGLHLGLCGLAGVWSGLLAGFAIAAVVGAVGIVAFGRALNHRFALGPSLVAGALASAWWFMPTVPIA